MKTVFKVNILYYFYKRFFFKISTNNYALKVNRKGLQCE